MAKDYTSVLIAGGVAVAAYFGYSQGWFSGLLGTPTASTPVSTTPATTNTPATSTSTTPISTIAPGEPSTVVTTTPITHLPPVSGPPSIGTSNVTGHYADVVTWMKSAAGNNTQSLDGWSFYFQQVNNSTVSPDLMSTIVNLAGGDRNRVITAEQFMTLLGNANGTWSGLSGFGPAGAFIPAMAIHRGGF